MGSPWAMRLKLYCGKTHQLAVARDGSGQIPGSKTLRALENQPRAFCRTLGVCDQVWWWSEIEVGGVVVARAGFGYARSRDTSFPVTNLLDGVFTSACGLGMCATCEKSQGNSHKSLGARRNLTESGSWTRQIDVIGNSQVDV